MNAVLLFALLTLPLSLGAQSYKLCFKPVWSGKQIELGSSINISGGDSVVLHTLKFYLGNFEFLKNGRVVFSEKNYRLLDLEEENSLCLTFDLPKNLVFNSLKFVLGTDSLTNVSGAMGGDLDPTLGMYWAWQSGYINAKIEGVSSRSPAPGGEFEWHLGGYAAPFQTVQSVVLPLSDQGQRTVLIDLAHFFEQVNWLEKSRVMSPSAEAARLMTVLATTFETYEK